MCPYRCSTASESRAVWSVTMLLTLCMVLLNASAAALCVLDVAAAPVAVCWGLHQSHNSTILITLPLPRFCKANFQLLFHRFCPLTGVMLEHRSLLCRQLQCQRTLLAGYPCSPSACKEPAVSRLTARADPRLQAVRLLAYAWSRSQAPTSLYNMSGSLLHVHKSFHNLLIEHMYAPLQAGPRVP